MSETLNRIRELVGLREVYVSDHGYDDEMRKALSMLFGGLVKTLLRQPY